MSGAVEAEGRFNVLLVEDNDADAMFARDALTRGLGSAIEITRVVRLEDALSALERHHFDVVLLDLGLPDSRGLPTFSVLHARFRQVPVVVISALSDETTMIDAVRLGAQEYLVKGGWYDASLLVRVMRHAMERQHLLRQLERSLANVRKLLQAIEGTGHRGSVAGGLAMCGGCKRLSAAPGRWETIDEYLAPREEAPLRQSTCPDCVERMRGETGNGSSGEV